MYKNKTGMSWLSRSIRFDDERPHELIQKTGKSKPIPHNKHGLAL
jgi:hypothetical protein